MSTVSETSNYEVTIVASISVSGAICIKLGDNYLGNTNTQNNCKLFTAEAATTAFTPTVGDNDVFTLKIAANETYHTLQYYTGSPRFAVYGGTQKNVVIYKKANWLPSVGGDGGEEPTATVTTDGAMNISQTGAKLSDWYSFSTGMVTETGLKYGTSSNSSTSNIIISGITASFSGTASGLSCDRCLLLAILIP